MPDEGQPIKPPPVPPETARDAWMWMAVRIFLNAIPALLLLGIQVFVVPKFAKMYAEILTDEPLPLLTRFVVSGGGVYVAIALLLAAGHSWFEIRSRRREWPRPTAGVGCTVVLLQLTLLSLAVGGLFLPLLRMGPGLGQ